MDSLVEPAAEGLLAQVLVPPTDLGQMHFPLFSPIIEQIKYPFEKCLQLIAALGKDQCPLHMEGEAETRRLQTASGLPPHLGSAKQKTYGLG